MLIGCVERVGRGARPHPVAVAPLVALELGDHRAVGGPQLHREPVGIGLEQRAPVARADLVLVGGAGADARDEQLPDAGRAARLHGVAAAVPEVERAHHAHALGVRRPHRETRAGAGHRAPRVRAELVVDAVVVALAEQVQVEVRQLRREVVRVVLGELVAVAVADVQPVRLQRPAERHAALEQAGRRGCARAARPGRRSSSQRTSTCTASGSSTRTRHTGCSSSRATSW